MVRTGPTSKCSPEA